MSALSICRLGICDLYQQERPKAYQRQTTKGKEDPFGCVTKTVPVIPKLVVKVKPKVKVI